MKTAFRKSELASLRVSNLRLDSEPHHIEIKARNAKNRTAAAVPIPAILAAALAKHIRGMDPMDKVFTFPSASGSIVTMLRRDLKGAGVACELGEREVRDFHTIRATAITWWLVEDGLTPKEVQVLARLKTSAMVDRYSRNYRLHNYGWLNKGPKLVSPSRKKRVGGRDEA